MIYQNLTCTWSDSDVISERDKKNKNQNHIRRHLFIKRLLHFIFHISFFFIIRQSIFLIQMKFFMKGEITLQYQNKVRILVIGRWWCEERKGTFECNRHFNGSTVYLCLLANISVPNWKVLQQKWKRLRADGVAFIRGK